MKKILLAILMVLLITGCTNNNPTNEAPLAEYKTMIALDNRDDLVIYYDFDGVFDKSTLSGLIELELEEFEVDDDHVIDGYNIKEIEDTTNNYIINIINATAPFFEYQYVEDQDMITDENDIRFILKNDDIKLNVYLNGYLKLVKEDSTTYYKCDADSFNDDIDKLYHELAELNAYLVDFRSEINK